MTLIVPIAADSPEYDCKLPPVFSLTEAGYMRCVQSVQALDLTRFDRILFVILDKHDRRFGIADMLRLQISRLGLDNAQVLILPEPTADQPETVAQTIAMAHLSGPVFIKDADCGFNAEWIPSDNCVAVHPLERLSLVDPQHKSYVTVDDMGFVTFSAPEAMVSPMPMSSWHTTGNSVVSGNYIFHISSLRCFWMEKRSVPSSQTTTATTQ